MQLKYENFEYNIYIYIINSNNIIIQIIIILEIFSQSPTNFKITKSHNSGKIMVSDIGISRFEPILSKIWVSLIPNRHW